MLWCAEETAILKISQTYNNRTFTAKNVDGERSKCNKVYVKENIKKVYHALFDEALEAYNAKQTRADRRIDDYEKKMRKTEVQGLEQEISEQKDKIASQSLMLEINETALQSQQQIS